MKPFREELVARPPNFVDFSNITMSNVDLIFAKLHAHPKPPIPAPIIVRLFLLLYMIFGNFQNISFLNNISFDWLIG